MGYFIRQRLKEWRGTLASSALVTRRPSSMNALLRSRATQHGGAGAESLSTHPAVGAGAESLSTHPAVGAGAESLSTHPAVS
jgi:hypothetical protein